MESQYSTVNNEVLRKMVTNGVHALKQTKVIQNVYIWLEHFIN